MEEIDKFSTTSLIFSDVSDVLHPSSGYNTGLKNWIKTYVLLIQHTGIKQAWYCK